MNVPPILGERAGATTDADGRAVLGSFRAEDLVGARVEAPGFGRQPRDFRGPDGSAGVEVKRITLARTGRVEGRVRADGPAEVGGLRVRLTSTEGAAVVGEAEATTDAGGRFEVEALAAGSVEAVVRPRSGSADLVARSGPVKLTGGGMARVDVSVRRGVRVAGQVLDRGNGAPVAGAVVALGDSAIARTDAMGRYEAAAAPGPGLLRVLKVPGPYLAPPPGLASRPVEVPPAVARFELPPIELARGVDLVGRVVDEAGRPEAGAGVEASWTLFEGRNRTPQSASGSSRIDGTFRIGPVDPSAELSIVAASGPRMTAAPTRARAADAADVRLVLVEPDAARPVGRVVGPDGRPIAGASVRVVAIGPDQAPIEARSDDQGRFEGPRRLRRDLDYRATATAPGRLPARSRPLRPGRGEALNFPDLVLAPDPARVAVEGRVVDAGGQPVPGARVWASAGGSANRAITDADGRFRLAGVPEGPTFLFAHRDRFRFNGRAIGPDRGPVRITLVRDGEAPGPDLARPAEPAPVRAATAYVRAAMAPYVERVLNQGDHATQARTFDLLARVDPIRALGLIDARAGDDPRLVDHVRHVAARALLVAGPEEARRAIEAIRDEGTRALAGLEAADALPLASRAEKGAWLDRALQDARATRDPSTRVVAMAGVAARMADLGQPDRAARLLARARAVAEGLPRATAGGLARSRFAAVLARFDPPRALAMADDLVDPAAADACRVEVAFALAARDPATSARIISGLRDPAALDGRLAALCRAMAPVAPARTRALIASARPGSDCQPAYALGMLALGVAPTDRAAALAWVREAFDRLGALAEAGSPPPGPSSCCDPATTAAALLPVVERIDPALVPEFAWRAVSFRPDDHGPRPRSDAVLALLLARYDRETALALLNPLLDHAQSLTDGDLAATLAAAALLAPLRALDLIEHLPEAPDLAFHHPKNAARLALAAAIARGNTCWDDALGRFLRLGPASDQGGE